MKLRGFFQTISGFEFWLLSLLTILVPTLRAQQPADIVFHNVKIITVDRNFSIMEAIAITGNKITSVGGN